MALSRSKAGRRFNPRCQFQSRWVSLENEGSEWKPHWKELAENFAPRMGRFLVSDVNKGTKQHQAIYDSTVLFALRTLAAGLMAGMTSPARPWHRLAVEDRDLMDFQPVKIWLDNATRVQRDLFARTNTYRALHTKYKELGLFGTHATIIADDFDKLYRMHSLTAGEYYLAQDPRRQINVLYREFNMTVSQMVREFGIENVSQTVKNLFHNSAGGRSGSGLDQWVTVMQAIEPRYERDPNARDNLNMPFRSVYFELGQDEDKLLRETGFQEFPALCPRWDTNSADIYGMSPAMEALGDAKQLAHEQIRKAECIDYKTDPPLAVPTSLAGSEIDRLPGGVTFVDNAGGQSAGIRSMFEVDLDIRDLREDILDARGRINQAFYVDMFLMIANDQRSNITAREIAERHEEKLLMLGPVLERLHTELLDPLIDITFTKMLQGNMLPPPPPELLGVELKVEFVSTLAQAQKAIGIESISRLVGGIGELAQLDPSAADKLNSDEVVDAYADALGVEANLIYPAEEVALVRQQRAQQQAQQQMMEAAPAAASAAASLSKIQNENPDAAQDVISQLQGYSAPPVL